MIKRKNKIFQDIMSGLDEVLEWTKGKTKAYVTFPGKKGKMMTRKEYDQEKSREASKS